MNPSANPQHSERAAVAWALGAVLLWSTVATGFKLGLAVLSVSQLLLAGSVVSWVLFAIAALVSSQWRIKRGDVSRVVALGVINPFAYYLILFEAYERLPAQIAQPLNYTWAVVLALLAVPLLGQRLSRRALAGILLSYAGVVVLLSHNPVDNGTGLDPIGITLAIVSTLLWALYWIFNTRTASAPLAIMFASFSVGTPLVALACWLGPGWPTLNTDTLVYGAWIGLIEMGITFLMWQRALRLTHQAGRIGQLIFLSPFLSLVLIAVVLGEPIGWTSVAGLTVIVAGLLVAGRPGTAPNPDTITQAGSPRQG